MVYHHWKCTSIYVSILTNLFFREARLSISPIETADEGEYKCEITFLGRPLTFSFGKEL